MSRVWSWVYKNRVWSWVYMNRVWSWVYMNRVWLLVYMSRVWSWVYKNRVWLLVYMSRGIANRGKVVSVRIRVMVRIYWGFRCKEGYYGNWLDGVRFRVWVSLPRGVRG